MWLAYPSALFNGFTSAVGRLRWPVAVGSLVVASALFGTNAYADKPDGPPGQDAPGCHGNNDSECKPDPQPYKGKDCLKSEDHVCGPTAQGDESPPGDSGPSPSSDPQGPGDEDGSNPPSGGPGDSNPPSGGPGDSNPPSGGPGDSNPPSGGPGNANPPSGGPGTSGLPPASPPSNHPSNPGTPGAGDGPSSPPGAGVPPSDPSVGPRSSWAPTGPGGGSGGFVGPLATSGWPGTDKPAPSASGGTSSVTSVITPPAAGSAGLKSSR